MRVFSSLVLLLTIFSISLAGKFEHVKSVTKDGDVFRALHYSEHELWPGCPSFSAHGVSINGSIFGGDDDVSVDTSVFKFTTCNVLQTRYPSYFFRFFSFAKNDDSDDKNKDGNSDLDDDDIKDDGSGSSVSKIAASFTPTFIIEYLENGEKEGFQFGQDTVLGYTNLAKLKYDLVKETVEMTGNNGKNFTVYSIDVTSTNGLFKMSFFISGAPINVGDIELSAAQSKVDISINGYYDGNINKKDCPLIQLGDYSCSSSGASSNNQSRIALTSFFATKSKGIEIDIEDHILNTDDDIITADFSWVSHSEVSVNGKKASVKVVSSSNDYVNFANFGSNNIKKTFSGSMSAQFLTFSFNQIRPDSIFWDPTLGASETSSSTHLIVAPFFILISLILALIL